MFTDHDGYFPIYTNIGEDLCNAITSLRKAVEDTVGEIEATIGVNDCVQ